MMRALIDTNVVLDLALQRSPFTETAQQLFDDIEAGKLVGYITASSTTDIFYILRKAQQREKALVFLKGLIQTVTMLDVSANIVNEALYSDFTDFEDAVQYYTAMTNGMDAIITRDPQDFTNSRIPVYSPEELMIIDFQI
ncbi:PIN domain-containing protein [Bacteroidia bacterium]|nr:PIN domain-containing protein [Bacteroidia bacterium]